MNEVNPKFKQYESTIEQLNTQFFIEREKYEKIIEGKVRIINFQSLNNTPQQKPDYRNQILNEKEDEINKIRSEYVSILDQKNNYIKEIQRDNEDHVETIETLKRQVVRLENDDKVNN